MIRNDQVRDKILRGRLRRKDCDKERVFNFLKLLKVPHEQQCQNNKEITEDD